MNEQQPQEPSIWQTLYKAPIYLLDYLGGAALGVLSDSTLTTLALASAGLGLALSQVWAGVSLFFGGYLVICIVNVTNQATIQAARITSRNLGGVIASVFGPQPERVKSDAHPHPFEDRPA